MTATKTAIHNWRQDSKSIWKFGGLTFRELIQSVLRGTQENEVFKRASGLAFDFLLALFPLLFILLAVFGLFTSHSLQLRASLLVYFADLLPAPAFQLLYRTTEELAANTSGGKLAIGVLTGLYLESGGVASIIAALNAAYRARESRSWFKVRAIALGLAVVISVLIITALCIIIVGGNLVDWLGNELHLTSAMIAFWKGLQWPTALLFVMLSDSLIYTLGPDLRDRRWRWATPGSVFGATTWLAASEGFRIYLRYANDYSVIFGSLGALIILMVWLYVTGLAFLIGGEINASIERAAAVRVND
jgi:membrane protein